MKKSYTAKWCLRNDVSVSEEAPTTVMFRIKPNEGALGITGILLEYLLQEVGVNGDEILLKRYISTLMLVTSII